MLMPDFVCWTNNIRSSEIGKPFLAMLKGADELIQII